MCENHHIPKRVKLPKVAAYWFAAHTLTNELKVLLWLKYIHKEKDNGLTKVVSYKKMASELEMTRQTASKCVKMLLDHGFIHRAGKLKDQYFVRGWGNITKNVLSRLSEDQLETVRGFQSKSFTLDAGFFLCVKKVLSIRLKSLFVIENIDNQVAAASYHDRTKNRKRKSLFKPKDQLLINGGDGLSALSCLKIASMFGKSIDSGSHYRKAMVDLGILDVQPRFQLLTKDRREFNAMKIAGFTNIFEKGDGYFVRQLVSSVVVTDRMGLDIQYRSSIA